MIYGNINTFKNPQEAIEYEQLMISTRILNR